MNNMSVSRNKCHGLRPNFVKEMTVGESSPGPACSSPCGKPPQHSAGAAIIDHSGQVSYGSLWVPSLDPHRLNVRSGNCFYPGDWLRSDSSG